MSHVQAGQGSCPLLLRCPPVVSYHWLITFKFDYGEAHPPSENIRKAHKVNLKMI